MTPFKLPLKDKGCELKIVYGFIHEELGEFSAWAEVAKANRHPPSGIKAFYREMSSGGFKLRPDELTTLVATYATYGPHLPNAEKVLVLGGILSACTLSDLSDSVSDDLSFFVSTAVQVLNTGEWGQIDLDRDFLEPICKAMRKVATKHLPLFSIPALQAYFSSSRRFTQYAKPEANNSFCLHQASWVLDDDVIIDQDSRSLPNQALMSIIFHFFNENGAMVEDKDLASDELSGDGLNPVVQKLVDLAFSLNGFSQAGLYIPVKYPDLLVVSLLVERFALAASTSRSPDCKEALLSGITSLVDLVIRNQPENLVSKDLNMFLTDRLGFVFYYPEAARFLEKAFLKSTDSMPAFTGEAAKAMEDFYWAIIKNGIQVHTKHSSEGYDNHHLITRLTSRCHDKLREPGALSKLRADQQAMLVSSIGDPELKRELLIQYKGCRGRVLDEDLGM